MSIEAPERVYAVNGGDTLSQTPLPDPTLIDRALARDEQSQSEIDRRFESMIVFAKRRDVNLPKLAVEGRLQNLLVETPQASELVDRIHDLAEETLESDQLLEVNPSLTARNLGVAADVTGDPGLMEAAIEALRHTVDANTRDALTTMAIALENGSTFTEIELRQKEEAREAKSKKAGDKVVELTDLQKQYSWMYDPNTEFTLPPPQRYADYDGDKRYAHHETTDEIAGLLDSPSGRRQIKL